MEDIWGVVQYHLAHGDLGKLRCIHRAASKCTDGLNRAQYDAVSDVLVRTTKSNSALAGLVLGAFRQSVLDAPVSAGCPLRKAAWSALNWNVRGTSVNMTAELMTCDCPKCFETLPCPRGTVAPIEEKDGDFLFLEACVDLPPWADGSAWRQCTDQTKTWGQVDMWAPSDAQIAEYDLLDYVR